MKVAYQFPDMNNYADFWPIRDIIQSRLKYLASTAKAKGAKRRSKSSDVGEESDGEDADAKEVSLAKGKGKGKYVTGA
jgi:hypothetical protein